MIDVILLLLGGLALFIYSIAELSAVMKEVFTTKVKKSIRRFTTNVFLAIIVGTIATILLDSSSAVIILVIVFINAQTITFKQAIGIIMGANIGTTFSSQIIAFDVAKYSIIPLIIGLGLTLFSSKENINKTGRALLYFGMLFFGLFIMEESVLPLKDSAVFENWIAEIGNNPLKGAMSGGIVTLIIQSSSATVGLAIVLGKQNLISIAGGIAVMLGAELGTCSDTLLATINGSRQALKAGVFHLLFNLISIAIGLLLFTPFVELITMISANHGIARHIANAHVLFNIGGVLLFLPFVSFIERALDSMIPEKAVTTSQM